MVSALPIWNSRLSPMNLWYLTVHKNVFLPARGISHSNWCSILTACNSSWNMGTMYSIWIYWLFLESIFLENNGNLPILQEIHALMLYRNRGNTWNHIETACFPPTTLSVIRTKLRCANANWVHLLVLETSSDFNPWAKQIHHTQQNQPLAEVHHSYKWKRSSTTRTKVNNSKLPCTVVIHQRKLNNSFRTKYLLAATQTRISSRSFGSECAMFASGAEFRTTIQRWFKFHLRSVNTFLEIYRIVRDYYYIDQATNAIKLNVKHLYITNPLHLF